MLTKTDDDAKSAKAAKAALKETACFAPDLVWRKGLWPEVAKAVMRQPRGGDLIKQLKKDAADLPGLSLATSSQQDSTDRAGKTHAATFTLKTVATKTAELAANDFKTPSGYRLFSPETVSLPKKASGPKAADSAPAGDESVFDFMRSAFFCALASRFVCTGKD